MAIRKLFGTPAPPSPKKPSVQDQLRAERDEARAQIKVLEDGLQFVLDRLSRGAHPLIVRKCRELLKR